MNPDMRYFFITFLSAIPSFCAENEQLNNYSLISWINRNQSSWTACENFPEDVSTEHLKRLSGATGLHPDPKYQLNVKSYKVIKSFIPEDFDAREAWPHCGDMIGNVRDQGICGSCWAFASAEVMSDRVCIRSNGTVKFHFSPEDLLECCPKCATYGERCNGGFTAAAWDYWITEGIVSGGDYKSNEPKGCKPYSYSAFIESTAPKCQQRCQDSYEGTYNDDKRFGSNVYQIGPNVEQIQFEIMTHGPVVAIYEVYTDFFYYQNGVYLHVLGSKIGNHAVKVIGWGTERGIPYWLVVNSWGEKWGGLGGFFKIFRGLNHCGFEQNVIAGTSAAPTISSVIPVLLCLLIFINIAN